jgi:hypothetical protein
MYPHSALIGGGTRDYYPNAVAQDLGGPVPPAPRRRILASLASVLRRRKAPSRAPSPLHPSVMSKARKTTRTGIAALLLVPLLAGSAVGDVVTRRDPKDTPGRLDIRRISHGHKDDAVVHTVSMYRRFPSRLLEGRGRALGIFLFNREEERVRIVVVQWRNGRLRAPVFDWEEGRVGTARVSRPNPRTIRVVISESVLGGLGESPGYRWFALTVFKDGGRCKRWCEDTAPNRRPIRHRILEAPPPEDPPEEVAP